MSGSGRHWDRERQTTSGTKECRDVRVGDVEARQVVSGVAEEVKQSVARRRDHFWDCLVTPGLWYDQTAVREEEKAFSPSFCL